MFGLFKQQKSRSAMKSDFESMIQQIRSVDTMKQGLVGRGILMAQEAFQKIYTEASFQALPVSERVAYMDQVRKIEAAISKEDGPIKICGIGYGLFNRWLAVTIMSDEASD